MKYFLIPSCIVLALLLINEIQANFELRERVQSLERSKDSLQVEFDASIEGWKDCLRSGSELMEQSKAISKHDRYLLDVMHDHKKVCPVW